VRYPSEGIKSLVCGIAPECVVQTTMRCPACRAEVLRRSAFCYKCGRSWYHASRLSRRLSIILVVSLVCLSYVIWQWVAR
jgi:hypothetical protein